MVASWRNASTLIVIARNSILPPQQKINSRFDYKVLMLKRSSKSGFMPNRQVFPGGAFSPGADDDPEWMKLFEDFGDINKITKTDNDN